MIVVDHTALVAIVNGHYQLGSWASVVADHPDDRLYAPALCLVEAAATHTGADVTGTVGAMAGMFTADLTFTGAQAVEVLLRAGIATPAAAHAVHVARAALLEGSPAAAIVTSVPEHYAHTESTTFDLRKL